MSKIVLSKRGVTHEKRNEESRVKYLFYWNDCCCLYIENGKRKKKKKRMKRRKAEKRMLLCCYCVKKSRRRSERHRRGEESLGTVREAEKGWEGGRWFFLWLNIIE